MRPARFLTWLDTPSGGTPGRLPALQVLGVHVVYTLLTTILYANVAWLTPLLVRLQFGSPNPDYKDWQTNLVTAAMPTLLIASVFWNELLRRTRLRTFLVVFWFVAALPLGCIGLVQSYPQLLTCHIIAMTGAAASAPLNGRLLKHLYPDAVRGRAYALLNVVTHAAAIVTAYGVGRWQDHNPAAFRLYFPLSAGVQIIGLTLIAWLARRTGLPDEPQRGRVSLAALLDPVLHMGRVLRADRTFLHYERAFMTYGAAFMLCDALLPVLATHKLGLEYKAYAESTQVTLKMSMLLLTLPMGLILDRLGAIRASGIAFAVLGVYPILLARAGGATDLVVASALYGVGMAGVQMGWMLGPVSLAPSPDRVPQYVAIHTTLVGIRGVIFQGLGMLLYKLSGDFYWPFALAAGAFLWAAIQMFRLQGDPLRRAVPPRGFPVRE
jgi:hypothetical protein